MEQRKNISANAKAFSPVNFEQLIAKQVDALKRPKRSTRFFLLSVYNLDIRSIQPSQQLCLFCAIEKCFLHTNKFLKFFQMTDSFLLLILCNKVYFSRMKISLD